MVFEMKLLGFVQNEAVINSILANDLSSDGDFNLKILVKEQKIITHPSIFYVPPRHYGPYANQVSQRR